MIFLSRTKLRFIRLALKERNALVDFLDANGQPVGDEKFFKQYGVTKAQYIAELSGLERQLDNAEKDMASTNQTLKELYDKHTEE